MLIIDIANEGIARLFGDRSSRLRFILSFLSTSALFLINLHICFSPDLRQTRSNRYLARKLSRLRCSRMFFCCFSFFFSNNIFFLIFVYPCAAVERHNKVSSITRRFHGSSQREPEVDEIFTLTTIVRFSPNIVDFVELAPRSIAQSFALGHDRVYVPLVLRF